MSPALERGECPRVAVVQARPVYLNREATLDKVVALTHQAADEGASVVVFPESFVPGFPYWPRAYPLPERRRSLDALSALREGAVRLGSQDLDAVRAAAHDRQVTLALGVTELSESPSLLFNSLVYIGPDGALAGVHRKLQLTFDEQCVWRAGDASGLSLVSTPAGRLGGLICGTNSMTLAKAALLLQGEQLHASLWPGYRWMWPQVELVSRGYALESRTFVMVASSVLTEADVPESHPLRAETVWDVPGGSGIVGPDGQWLVGPVFHDEVVLTAEIDLEKAQKLRDVRDAVDTYGRPDLFRLHVNVAPQRLRGTHVDAVAGSEWRVWA